MTVTLLALLVLAAVPAWAADKAGEEGRDLIMPVWAEVGVAIGTFLILLFILGKMAWKPILNGLQEREATIKKALDDAQKANEDALALLAQYEGKMEEAKSEAQAIADEARRDAEAAKRHIEEDATANARKTLERSLREIDQAKHKALDDLLQDVTNIASEAASRIVQRHLSPEDNAALVDVVVQDFVKSRGGEGA
jgi:F-type H+-transporting ATPase subunit b